MTRKAPITPRPRRPKGTGSVFQRKDGRWTGVLDRGRDPLSGQRRRPVVYGSTAVEAETALDRLLATIRSGREPADQAMPLGTYLAQWLESRRPGTTGGWKPKTYISYESLIRCHIECGLGRVPVGALTPADVSRWQTTMRTRHPKPVGGRTVEAARACLSSALSDAVEEGYSSINACAGPRSKRRGHQRKVPTPWTLGQARQFIAGIETEEHPLRFMWLLMILCGPRIGECLSLTWSCVDLEAGRLSIAHTLTRVVGYAFIGDTKSEAGRRVLSMPPVVVEALKSQKASQDLQRTKAGDDWDEFGLVFTRSDGSPMRSDSTLKTLYRAQERLGVPRVRQQDLRRLFAALQFTASGDMSQVRQAMGHSSIQLSADYAYSLDEVADTTASKVADLLRPRA